jgi:hypothetical protein
MPTSKLKFKPDFDFVTDKFIKDRIDESKNHPTRIAFLAEAKRARIYYLATNKSYMIHGEQDIEIETSESRPVGYENLIYKCANDIVSLLLKNNPIVRHYPFSDRPEDGELADNMDDILAAVWRPDGGNIANVIQQKLLEAVITGMGVSKSFWDHSSQLMGNGQVAGIVVPNTDLFFDPYARNDQRALDCRYIIHRTLHSKEYIREKFRREGEIALGEKGSKREKKENDFIDRWGKFKDFVNEELVNPLFGGGSSTDPNEKVEKREEVYEAWLFPTVSSDSNLLSGETIEDKDFPYGIVAYLVRDHIIKDKIIANPNASERDLKEQANEFSEPVMRTHILGSKRHPFVPMFWQPSTDSDGNNYIYCTKGAVSNAIPVQISFNALSTNIQKNALTLGNPAVKVIENSVKNLPPDMITWTPGQIFIVKEKYMGRDPINIIQGAQLPNYIFEMRNSKRQAISEIMGLNFLLTGIGNNPQIGTSHTPSSTIAGIQEASFAPLFTPVAELSRAIFDMSILLEGLMQQYYNEGRFINVTTRGKQIALAWKEAYLSANFIRQVVSGSTTPMQDMGRQQDVMMINQMVMLVLAQGTPEMMESVIVTLKNMNRAYTWDYIQLLQKAIAQREQMQQGVQQLGQASIEQQMMGQNQQGMLPDSQQGMGQEDMMRLLEEMSGSLEGQV